MSNIYTIPNSIIAFDGSGVLNTDIITAVNFESGSQCTTIDDYAFQNWTSLVSIDFSNANITNIKNYSFSNCLSLQEIVIPNTVTFIGDFSFINCPNLITIDMTNNTSLISIGSYTFNNCIKLTNLYFPENCPSFTTIPDYLCSYNSSLTNVTLGNYILNIGKYAFNCCNLSNLNIPSSVTEIYSFAFYGNKNLYSLTFNDSSSIETIGAFAFSNCNLSSIQYYISSTLYQGFPLSLNIIGDNNTNHLFFNGYSFLNNFNLDISTFVFNNTITINYFSFYNCLNSIINSSNSSQNITLLPPDNPLILTSTNCTVTNGVLQHIIDNNYTSISFDSTFAYLNCTSLGVQTFNQWVMLQSINFENVGNTLINLGFSTFSSCVVLSNITIPPTITIIDSDCFACSSLSNNIIIPASVVSINNGAFLNTLITTVTIQNMQLSVTIADNAFPKNVSISYSL